MGEVTVEERGRIIIPKDIREKMDLKGGEKMKVEKKNDKVVLKPLKSGKSLKELKGCVKDSEIDPMEVKDIWQG